MCGICGFLTSKNIDGSNLVEMNDTLRHRGPDDSGIFLAESGGTYTGLAHRRLSVQDLSVLGHQPMSSRDGSITVVFNGEIYNFIGIRKELENRGYRLKSNSDTEVIICSYEEWGIRCLEKFNGMFAIAIYDRKSDTVYLARDRLGKKPLYYYLNDGDFVFASEIKAILKYKYFIKDIDREALYQYLIYQYIPAPKSIFKNVCKLLPGSYLEYANNSFRVFRYWDIADICAKPDRRADMSEEEYIEGIDRLLTSSVGYRMISDVPLGAFLSGGIDSSLVVSIMSRMGIKPVKTFSIGFIEDEYNEAAYAKEISQYLGTEHYEAYVSSRDALDTVYSLACYYDEPFGDDSAIPTYLVSRLAKGEVTVALSGDAGDELFCGYGRYEYMSRIEQLFKIPQLLRRPALAVACSLMGKAYSRSILTQDTLLSSYRELVSICSRSLADRLLNSIGSGAEFDMFDDTFKRVRSAGRNSVESIMAVDINTYLCDCILTKLDRASMAVSLEARVPFLDYRLVEFSQQIPLNVKYKNGVLKYPLKKLLARYLPEKLFQRPKHGFGIPLDIWLRNDLKALLDQYMNEIRIKKEGFFQYRCLNGIIKDHMEYKSDNSLILWALLMFEMWFEKYME